MGETGNPNLRLSLMFFLSALHNLYDLVFFVTSANAIAN